MRLAQSICCVLTQSPPYTFISAEMVEEKAPKKHALSLQKILYFAARAELFIHLFIAYYTV